jgi:hypothetical protein
MGGCGRKEGREGPPQDTIWQDMAGRKEGRKEGKGRPPDVRMRVNAHAYKHIYGHVYVYIIHINMYTYIHM